MAPVKVPSTVPATMSISPPMAKSEPGAPEFVSVTVLGPVGRKASVPPLDPVSALAVLMTRTTWPLVPATLCVGTEVTSVPQVSSPPPKVVQSRTFALLRVTVRVAVTPAAGITITPKSSTPVAVRLSGFTTRARAVAGVVAPTGAAAAGGAIIAVGATDAARHVIRRSFVILLSPLVPNHDLPAGRPLVRSPVTAALTPCDYGLLQGHGYRNGKDSIRFEDFSEIFDGERKVT